MAPKKLAKPERVFLVSRRFFLFFSRDGDGRLSFLWTIRSFLRPLVSASEVSAGSELGVPKDLAEFGGVASQISGAVGRSFAVFFQ